MEQDALDRLKAKSPEEAIIEQIGRDFNLADSVPDCVGEFGHLLVAIASPAMSKLAPAPPTADTDP